MNGDGRMNKQIKKIVCIIIAAVIILGNSKALSASAAQPKMILTGYEINKNVVNAGDEFMLKLTFKNTYSYSIKNIKVSVVGENGNILPANGTAGTAYVDNIYGDTEEIIELNMKAAEGLEEKSYKLTVKCEYEDGYGNPYTSEDSIFIPIYLEQKLSVTDIVLSSENVDLGEELGISGKVNNMGDGKLYNVCVKISGKVIASQESYLGNIDPGKSANFDMYARAIDATEGKVMMSIAYEDIKGITYEYILSNENPININVTKPIYEDLVVVKEEAKKDNSVLIAVCVVGIILILITIFGLKKISNKKRILEDY